MSNDSHGLQYFSRGRFLQDEAAGAGADGAHHQVLVTMHGKNHHPGLRALAQNLHHRLNSVYARKGDVHDHQLGIHLPADLHCLVAAARLARYGELVIAREDGFKAVADNLVIVYQQNAECHGLASVSHAALRLEPAGRFFAPRSAAARRAQQQIDALQERRHSEGLQKNK